MLLLLKRPVCYLLEILAAQQSWSTFYRMTDFHPLCILYSARHKLQHNSPLCLVIRSSWVLLGWRDTEGVGVVKPWLTHLFQTSLAERDAQTAVPNKASGLCHCQALRLLRLLMWQWLFTGNLDKSKHQNKREWVMLAGLYYFDMFLCWLVW